jgi:hypothetical protein
MGDREFRDLEKNLKRTPKKDSFDETSVNQPPTKMDDPFSHPVYNTISYMNGQINRMDLYQV